MAAVTTIIAAGALAVAAGSAYQAQKQSKEAASERKKASNISRAEGESQSAENRRQQIREERVRRATIMQSSENTGVTASSGELGSLSVLGSQVGGNIANISRQDFSAGAITNLNQSAANADYKANQAAQIGQFAGTVFGMTAPSAIGGLKEDPNAVGKTKKTVFE